MTILRWLWNALLSELRLSSWMMGILGLVGTPTQVYPHLSSVSSFSLVSCSPFCPSLVFSFLPSTYTCYAYSLASEIGVNLLDHSRAGENFNPFSGWWAASWIHVPFLLSFPQWEWMAAPSSWSSCAADLIFLIKPGGRGRAFLVNFQLCLAFHMERMT